jgi:hypothetical protein
VEIAMQLHQELPFTDIKAANVRVIEQRPDPYIGLKGHAYIMARGLNAKVQRVQTSAHAELVSGEVCK